MDERRESGEWYPGGTRRSGGSSAGGDAGGSSAPKVPVTQVSGLPENYRESDMKDKINQLCRIVSGGVAALAAMVGAVCLADGGVTVQGARKDALWNSDFVVTNVTVELGGFVTTNQIAEAKENVEAETEAKIAAATNDLAGTVKADIASTSNSLAVAMNLGIAAATNSQDEATEAKLTGYATREWVQGRGYLTETNMNSYAQVDWVQEQGYATRSWTEGKGYLTPTSLVPYASREWVQGRGYLTPTNLTPYAQRTWVQGQGYLTPTNLEPYATQEWVEGREYARMRELETLAAEAARAAVGTSDGRTAHRLMAPESNMWIDGTGTVWQVESRAEWNGGRVEGEIGATNWTGEGWALSYTAYTSVTGTWTLVRTLSEDGPLTVEYEGTGLPYEEGTFALRAERAMLEGYETTPGSITADGWYQIADGQENLYFVSPLVTTVTVARVTNAVDRLAKESKLAIDVASEMTTNDVCAIVTNEVETGFTEWVCVPPSLDGNECHVYEYGGDGQAWMLVCAGSQYAQGYSNSTSLTWTIVAGTVTATRQRITRNALGLARIEDIPSTVSNVVTESYIGDMLPAETDPVWSDEKSGYATTGAVASVSQSVGVLWSYVYGDTVWIAVTNYMRSVAGVSPSFQLWEVRDGTTNCVYWSREEITNVTHDLIYDCKTNLETTVAKATNAMPDKAWSKYQSATGADNPQPGDITIVSTPTIMLSGGWEWQRYGDVGNSVWLLQSNGLTTMGGDTNGYFRISDIDGNSQFEVVKTDSYLIDAIPGSVNVSGGMFMVSFTNGLTKLCVATNLAQTVWEEIEYDGNSNNELIFDTVLVVIADQSGNATAVFSPYEVDTLPPQMFVYGKVEQLGGTVIKNVAPVSVHGGIYCTDGIHKVRPVYSNGAVTWEVVQ